MSLGTPSPTGPPLARRALSWAAPLCLGALLAACGGDASWCFSDSSGSMSMGYNSANCPASQQEAATTAR